MGRLPAAANQTRPAGRNWSPDLTFSVTAATRARTYRRMGRRCGPHNIQMRGVGGTGPVPCPGGVREAVGVRSVAALWDVLARGAGMSDGEVVDLLTHGLQCAALLARSHPEDPELQVAGLVHDIGTIVRLDDPAGHAARGARLVRPLLGERVAWLVGAHVRAKQWLVGHDPGYRALLSPVSVATLAAQGEALGARAAATFERHPWFAAAVALRRADDAAKDPSAVVPGLAHWRPVVEEVARRRRT